jgi:hypothetical protein
MIYDFSSIHERVRDEQGTFVPFESVLADTSFLVSRVRKERYTRHVTLAVSRKQRAQA